MGNKYISYYLCIILINAKLLSQARSESWILMLMYACLWFDSHTVQVKFVACEAWFNS
jgi:hypothetical protein